MAQLIEYVTGKGSCRKRPIVLSFDDGYLSTYYYALPLLKKYDYENCLFRHREKPDDFTQIPDNNIDYSHVTWTSWTKCFLAACGSAESYDNLHSITKNRYGCMQRPTETGWKRMSRRWQTIF
jgi:hypothetical protein